MEDQTTNEDLKRERNITADVSHISGFFMNIKKQGNRIFIY